MKHILYKLLLRTLRKLALIIQIGNPNGKAPILIDNPDNKEKLINRIDDFDSISIWNLQNITCFISLYQGAIINAKNQIYSRFISYPWGKDLHPSLTLPYLGRQSLTIEKAIFLITPEAKGNYYHWIADLLPRLMLIQKYNIIDFKDRSIIIHNSDRGYENATFSLLKIEKDKIIRINPFELIEVQDLIIADYIDYGENFPSWKKILLDELKYQVINTRSEICFNKVYLLRGNQSKRRLIGEERLVSLLKEQGFIILDPQFMSFEDQANALWNAKVVVAMHGAALVNTIFCRELTSIIELRSSHKPPEYFSSIAKTYNLKFDTVHLPPKRLQKKSHVANKEDLLLTESSISILMDKLKLIS